MPMGDGRADLVGAHFSFPTNVFEDNPGSNRAFTRLTKAQASFPLARSVDRAAPLHDLLGDPLDSRCADPVSMPNLSIAVYTFDQVSLDSGSDIVWHTGR